MPLYLGLSDIFSYLETGFYTGAQKPQEGRCIPQGVQELSVAGDGDLDHLFSWWVPADIFPCVDIIFLFVVNKHLGVDTLELCKYLISPQSLTFWF